MKSHSTAIANEFLDRANATGKTLTQMQLQKLVYIANGWSLSLLDEQLVEDTVQAWDYGPVFPELWEALRGYGRSPITKPILKGDFGFNAFSDSASEKSSVELSTRQTDLIDKVFETYGKFHAFQLSAMTHQDGTPWHKIFVTDGRKRGEIPTELIKKHFCDLRVKRSKAKAV